LFFKLLPKVIQSKTIEPHVLKDGKNMYKITPNTILITLISGGLLAAIVLTACTGRPKLQTQQSTMHATEQPPYKKRQAQSATVEVVTENLINPKTVETTTMNPTPDPIQQPPTGAEREFNTDSSKHTVSFDEILSGGPPKDGIPAIDNPKFISIEEADTWLEDHEPVVLVKIKGDARAYPLQILIWHEIVNDRIGDTPAVVTFCPLCNTAIAFESTVKKQATTFGTTGRLRYSNLIMYDRLTESWWQQATGDAIAGEMTGTQLNFIPAAIISWEKFKSSEPEGMVLSRETGYQRNYGRNPYTGYDNIDSSPFLYDGPQTPEQLPPMERVLTVQTDEEAVAYPYNVLQEVHIVNDVVGGEPIVVFWAKGTASALDRSAIAQGVDVGSATAFSRILNSNVLTFSHNGDNIIDNKTKSIWSSLGTAISGPLQGSQLEAIVSINHFWFSWAAFRPDTRVYIQN